MEVKTMALELKNTLFSVTTMCVPKLSLRIEVICVILKLVTKVITNLLTYV